MMQRCVVLGLCLALVCLGCAEKGVVKPEPVRLDPTQVDGARAFDEVASLVALGLRDSGTEGALRAADHLKLRLETLGVDVEVQSFEEDSPKGTITFRNVIGKIKGKGPGIIMLGSHYDTKTDMDPGFEGANDSGSSTGLLLELARILRDQPDLPMSIWFAFFDGEECMRRYGPRDGFHGSRYMAAQFKESGLVEDVRAMILLDMIGDKNLNVTIPRNVTPALATLAFDAARAEGVRDKFSFAPYQVGDDHDQFLLVGIPAIDLIDFNFGSKPRKNDYWHTAEDTMDKISAESLGTMGRVVIRMLESLLNENTSSQ